MRYVTKPGASPRLPAFPGSPRRSVRSANRAIGITLHLGFSGLWSWQPSRGGDKGRRGVSFSESAELNLNRREPFLRTGFNAASDVRVGGAEFGLGWERLLLQGEYYGIAADRPRSAGGTLGFSGFYAQASYVLLGKPRQYQASNATWSVPGQSGDGFDPRRGDWGALELGARFSQLDLDSKDVRGGVQSVVSVGFGWWPTKNLAGYAQWQHVENKGGDAGYRRFQALSVRLQASF